MDSRRILVTGSEGYIGSMLVPILKVFGHEIIRFDKIFGNDVLDFSCSERIDCIVHLAAIVGLKEYDKNPEKSWEINTVGTQNVVKSGQRVILASVTGSYKNHNGVITEETEADPKHDYFRSKIEAEKIVLAVRENNVVLRFGSLYGVSNNMRWDLLVHDFCKRASRDGRIELFQSESSRALTNMYDAVRAITFMMEREDSFGVYNVVSCNKKKIDIVRQIEGLTGCNVITVDGHDVENRNYVVSSKKINKLGFGVFPDFERRVIDILRVCNG